MIPKELFSDAPRERIQAAASRSDAERRAILDALAADSPYKPWPRGMPAGANPLLVVIGVSPGNSPPTAGAAFLDDYTPTFGVAADGFKILDTSHYLEKIRLLSSCLVRVWDETLSEDDCLAVTAHLNLGTGMFGVASEAAVEPNVVRWVASVVQRFRPRLVVGLGLVSLLTSPGRSDVRRAWGEHGLGVDWINAEIVVQDAFKFRRYVSQSDDGRKAEVLLWPNHPSRPPFGGHARLGGAWHRSALAAAELIRRGRAER